ncbi:MAG: hypothetical protein L0Y54_23240 [Sporichthyaceae bacterium]|nr:hypothetical protein [Sporichthyaceae bacterium]
MGDSQSVRTAANSAQAPERTRPTTRVPGAGPVPSAAARSTTPARSQPVADPSGSSGNRSTSPRFSENARIRTSTSPGAGIGSGTSANTRWGTTLLDRNARTSRP